MVLYVTDVLIMKKISSVVLREMHREQCRENAWYSYITAYLKSEEENLLRSNLLNPISFFLQHLQITYSCSTFKQGAFSFSTQKIIFLSLKKEKKPDPDHYVTNPPHTFL